MNTKLRIDSVDWKEFKISDVFDIITGYTIKKQNLSVGLIPRITATDSNSGISFFC